jgi:crotonobetainyl-CoA:carnitine CoA-transferase CaiB-like acyl-CoA transferase
LRVIDLTSGVAGPLATMVFSDHGADVIKVEPPAGDPMRGQSAYVAWNRGKRSVVIDLNEPSGQERFLALLGTADVLVESFSPGVMADWGLDYETLRDAFPGLIYCSVTGYGRKNRAEQRPGYDLLVQARSGEQFEQPGWREGPIYLYLPLPSLATSFLTLNGILAALHVRNETGRGQWVETSLYQGVLGFTTQLWQDAEKEGPDFWGIPREVQPSMFECADGLWVHSMHNAGGRGKDKSVLWTILGIEPQDITSLDPEVRARNETELKAAFARIPRAELLAQFWANDLAIAPVQQTFEIFDDEQAIANGLVATVDDPVHGPTRQVGRTVNLHGAPATDELRPQPAVGQHTDEVLTELASTPSRSTSAGPAKRSLRYPLEGIKVLDLGNFLAGPFGPMLLGDLGATVYKLESTEGDQMRRVTKPFNGCQRGKIDIAVDLKSPEGRAIAQALIAEVDIVHHNMRPGVAERLGVDYETAKRLNPDVIYTHTTMWGLQGPRSGWPGFDQLGQSSCGCEWELGGEGNPPVWYRFGMCDQACACLSAVGMLMALLWRDQTGEGQFVDSSILGGGMYYNSDVWIGADGPPPRARLDGNQTGISPLYRLYATTTEWIALVVAKESEWAALAAALPELADDARFATAEDRRDNGPALAELLEKRFAGDSAQAWFTALDAHGVPVEIADPAAPTSWFDDPELVANGLVADYQHPEYGRFRQFGHLVHFSETPGNIAGPPPRLGENSVDVLKHLGYSDDAIADLGARGVTTWPRAAVD